MRKTMTDAERLLWSKLRMNQLNGVHFRRQHPVGPYITDFCAPSHLLIIELDGGHHATQEAEDDRRLEYLSISGYKVLRFWNNEVLQNIDGVVKVILDAIASPSESPPSIDGGDE